MTFYTETEEIVILGSKEVEIKVLCDKKETIDINISF